MEMVECTFGIRMDKSESGYRLLARRQPLVDIVFDYTINGHKPDKRIVTISFLDNICHPSQRRMSVSDGGSALYSRTGISDIITVRQPGFRYGLASTTIDLGERNLIATFCPDYAIKKYHKATCNLTSQLDSIENEWQGWLLPIDLIDAISFYKGLLAKLEKG